MISKFKQLSNEFNSFNEKTHLHCISESIPNRKRLITSHFAKLKGKKLLLYTLFHASHFEEMFTG